VLKIESDEKKLESIIWIYEDGTFIYWTTPSEYMNLKATMNFKSHYVDGLPRNIETLWTFAPVELTSIYEKLKFKKGRKETIISYKI